MATLSNSSISCFLSSRSSHRQGDGVIFSIKKRHETTSYDLVYAGITSGSYFPCDRNFEAGEEEKIRTQNESDQDLESWPTAKIFAWAKISHRPHVD